MNFGVLKKSENLKIHPRNPPREVFNKGFEKGFGVKKAFFAELERILYAKERKFEAFRHFYEDFKSGNFDFDFESKVLLQSTLSENLHNILLKRFRKIIYNLAGSLKSKIVPLRNRQLSHIF